LHNCCKIDIDIVSLDIKAITMGKIILEFDSEEEDDARTALDGSSWKVAMWKLDQELRSVVKYGTFNGREATEEERNMAKSLRDSIREILDRSNLNLEK
jgi:hypothetical protein